MIEEPKTVLECDESLHSDILYALLLAINLSMAVNKMNKSKDGADIDEQAIKALSTSAQLPNVLAIASALTMCARTLIVSKTIDFDKQFNAMWNSHPLMHDQLSKEKCKEFFTGSLDIESSDIVLDS